MAHNYFGVQAISNTALGYINPEEKGCPEKFFDFIEGRSAQKESKAMLTGNLVHAQILEPETIQVIRLPKISDKVREIIDIIYLRVKEEEYDLFTDFDMGDHILRVAAELEYGQNWKPETLIKKVRTEGGDDYFKMLQENEGKTLVSEDVYANLQKIVSAIKMNPAANEVFEDKEGIVSENELEVFFKHLGLDCKAKIDRIILNQEDMTYSIVDLKTTSESVEFFPNLFLNRHIYRQLAFYELAVEAYLKGIKDGYKYTPDLHVILVAETTGYHRVRKFSVSRSFIDKGKREIESLMKRVKWHFETGEKIHSMEDIMSEFAFILEGEND